MTTPPPLPSLYLLTPSISLQAGGRSHRHSLRDYPLITRNQKGGGREGGCWQEDLTATSDHLCVRGGGVWGRGLVKGGGGSSSIDLPQDMILRKKAIWVTLGVRGRSVQIFSLPPTSAL